MTKHQAQAAEIIALLGLNRPPVAMAFMNDAPADVPATSQVSPASCAFWPKAETSVFYATAVQHHHCQIGAMVMGFELPSTLVQEIGGLVEAMCGCNYLSPAEGELIPSVGGGAEGILYGPLAHFPSPPDAILFWLNSAQAMIYNETTGSASWASSPTRITGRPGCAAIPMAIKDDSAMLSFGCKGMRTFTEIADDQMLAVVPGGKLGDFLAALRITVSANEEMESYYAKRKAEIAATASAG